VRFPFEPVGDLDESSAALAQDRPLGGDGDHAFAGIPAEPGRRSGNIERALDAARR
jgi:hypothetical protein